jgi:hypothetical protein
MDNLAIDGFSGGAILRHSKNIEKLVLKCSRVARWYIYFHT